MFVDIKDATHSVRGSEANILSFINLGNTITLYFVSWCQLYYNWVDATPVIHFVRELQHNYCLREMSTSGRSGVIMAYVLWISCILLIVLVYSLDPFAAPDWELERILENSATAVPRYFPTYVMNHPGLKYVCQFSVILIQFYAVMFVFMGDIIGIPMYIFTYVITMEFFLKLYESFKEVQYAKNVYFSGWILMIYIMNISFYSLHTRESIDSLGLTGQDVDAFTRFSRIIFIFELTVLHKAPADVCILCKKLLKILRGNLLLDIPIYKLHLILGDISDGVQGISSGRFLRITPAACGR
ncbi:unnamed protein product, partial [Allacma fusca]